MRRAIGRRRNLIDPGKCSIGLNAPETKRDCAHFARGVPGDDSSARALNDFKSTDRRVCDRIAVGQAIRSPRDFFDTGVGPAAPIECVDAIATAE